MKNYITNVWIVSETEFEMFTYTGGKVIYIAEDMDVNIKNHPSVVTAGILLPPVDCVSSLIDGDYELAANLYYSYLLNSDANIYVNIILAAAIQNTPIGIMFGKDEINMGSPSIFLNFMYYYYGLVVGVSGLVDPYIDQAFIPNDLASLYNASIISSKVFFEMHPADMPISENAISKLACELNPLVEVRDFQHYYNYFDNLKNSIKANHGKYVSDIMEGI